MRRRALIILIAIGMAVGGPQPALACSCPAFRTTDAEGAYAAVVFTGVVTRVSGNPFGFICSSSADAVSVEFDVETVYKGAVGRTIVVNTAASSASCGYTFEKGKRYTVFPRAQAGGGLNAGLCQGTVEGTIDPGVYRLEEGRPPRT